MCIIWKIRWKEVKERIGQIRRLRRGYGKHLETARTSRQSNAMKQLHPRCSAKIKPGNDILQQLWEMKLQSEQTGNIGKREQEQPAFLQWRVQALLEPDI